MNIGIRMRHDEQGLVRLLNWLTHENARLLRAHPDWPGLYESGVEYRRERREDWLDYAHLLQQGWEDCDGPAAARAGELIARGWRAIPRGYSSWGEAQRLRPSSIYAEVEVRTEVPLGSTGLYHCIVRYRVGDRWFWDDPSARLGMFPRRYSPQETEAYLARQYTPSRTSTSGVETMSFRPLRRFSRLAGDLYGAARDWGPTKVISNRLQVRARVGHRAAVLELRPGLYIVADVPEQTVRGAIEGSEVGVAPLLIPMIVTATKAAIDAVRPDHPAERPILRLPDRRRVIDVPEWVDEDVAAELGCACQRGA